MQMSVYTEDNVVYIGLPKRFRIVIKDDVELREYFITPDSQRPKMSIEKRREERIRQLSHDR